MGDVGDGTSDPYGTPPPGQPGWGTPPPAQPGWGTPPPGYGQPPAGYGPPPGYGQQPGWGPPGPYYSPPQADGKAIGALVASILSFVLCPLIPAIVGVILAGQAARDIEASQGRRGGQGLVQAARIIGWINIGLSVLGIVAIVLIAAASSGTSY